MKIIINTYIFVAIISSINIPESLVNCANDKIEDVFEGAESVKCDNRTDERAENLMPLLMPLGTDQRIPETSSELKRYCNLATKSMPFILGVFKHCTSPFAKTTAKFMFFPMRRQLASICKAGKITRSAKEFMTAAKCGNLARQPLKECNNNFIDALNGISLAPVKSRIYMTCCHSNAYRQCLREVTEDTVGCTRHTVDWAERLVLKVVGGSIDLFCGEYFEESDKCTKLIDKTPKPQYSKTNKRPKSFVKPMITLMESFPELDAD